MRLPRPVRSCPPAWSIALLAFVLTLSTARSVEAALSQRPFRSGFGVVVKFDQGQPAADIATLRTLGVSWVRDTVAWDVMEPRDGDFQPFPKAFQDRLSQYRGMGIGVVYILAYANARAHPPSSDNPLAPIDPRALGRYAAHVTRLLKQAGVPFVIQVWNEPHNFQVMKMVGGRWNGEPPSPWVGHYVEMVRAVEEAVHSVTPGAAVISSEDVWVSHYRFLAHPRWPKGKVGIGLHAYADQSSSGPEVASPYADSDWARPFQLVDRDRGFDTALRRLLAHGRAHGGTTPDIWITEWGFKLGGRDADGVITDERVAAFLPRAFVLAEAGGVKALCWFSLFDAQDGPYGLLDGRSRPRAAFRAYAAMARLVGDSVLTDRLSDAAQRTRGVQAYLFEKGAQRTLMLWSADNRAHTVALDDRWDASSVHNVYGDPVRTASRAIEVGAAPVYVVLGERGTPGWPPKE